MSGPQRVISNIILTCIVCTGAHLSVHAQPSDPASFVCAELLGRPTGNSIALNAATDRDAEIFVEFGRSPGSYEGQTGVQATFANQPVTILVAPLQPDTRYYFRVRYRAVGGQDFAARAEHSFHTARPRGGSFRFAIEADPHLDEATNGDLLRLTLGNILAGGSDFLIDLGDTFMSDKLPVIDSSSILARHLLLRTYYDAICHSVPLYLVLGNHEGENGWYLNGTPGSLGNTAAAIRLKYYPNPRPGAFYSGDTTVPAFVGPRGNAYAWEWGNVLFVVLDPYWYTALKPGTSTDNWGWTLGRAQYDWFSRVLSASNAPFKFVFAHQVVGGLDAEGRGGIEAAPFYEMGGSNADGSFGFASHRPGWPMPIHTLMKQNHVSAFFHGHDHVFVQQELDGITYQELPQPGYYNFSSPEKSYSNIGLAAKYGYTHGQVLSSSGYLRVTVDDSTARVDYIRSYMPEHENSSRHNGDVGYSYVLKPSGVATTVPAENIPQGDCLLEPNYPNPFNPQTTLSFRTGQNGNVRLEVVNVLGETVRTIIDEQLPAGNHTVRFDATALPSGVYCAVLSAGGRLSTRMMVYQK
jgi:hypothetical protein